MPVEPSIPVPQGLPRDSPARVPACWEVERLAGMCHLHGLDVVHGDINPQNILASASAAAAAPLTRQT